MSRWLYHLGLVALVTGVGGCGGGDEAGTVPEEQLVLESGLTVEASPGAPRDRQTDSPRVWLARPNASITVRTGPDDPAEQTLRVANVHPSATFRIASANYLTGSERDGCPEQNAGSIDCSTATDPICRTLATTTEGDVSTVSSLALDPPPCARVGIESRTTLDRSQPYRIALVGAADGLDDLAETVGRAAGEATLVVLTGDYAPASTAEGLDLLADELEGLGAPVVFTPGEREIVSGATREFQRRFGAVKLGWRLGGVQYLGVPSPRQRLSPESLDSLESRLSDLSSDDAIVAVTHTPPLDPVELRDRGFRSRVEGARLLSTLSTYRTDLLVAGHLSDRQHETYDGVEEVVPPKLGKDSYLVVELTTRTAGAESKLDVELDPGGG